MKKNNAFRRAAALMAALSITVSLAAPAFADTYYIDYGDITITKNEDGSQTIEQGGDKWTDKAGEETVITTSNTVITTLESDLEGPAAEDSGFGPVVEDNYQPAPPAQPEDAEEPKDADQPEDDDQKKSTEESEDDDQKNAEESENDEEQKDADRQENTDRQESAEEQESAGQQPQPQQAAPADAAPAAPAPANGFCKNIITVINNAATALKLTLKDVKIDVSDTGLENHAGKAALSVQGKGNVEIELDGNNELKSGPHRAGLEKNTSTSTGTLTLKDDNNEAGSLTATGGDWGAGIGNGGYYGNSDNRSGENITIIFINNAIYGMTGGQMAPTTLVGMKTSTSPYGRDVHLHGYPLKMADIAAQLEGTAYVTRQSVQSVPAIRKAKKAIRKAFENSMAGKGSNLVEIVSTCNSGWKMSPAKSNEWMVENMFPFYPLGDLKDK